MLEDLIGGNFGEVVDLLVEHGVTPVDATRFVVSAVTASRPPATFYEVYGQGGLTNAGKKYTGLNVQGLRVLDLRSLRPDGECWDFTRRSDRDWAWRLFLEQKPDWVIGAPPCTDFSMLNVGLNFPRMNPDVVKRRVEMAMLHIRFVVKMYKHQMQQGKFFLHEHPRGETMANQTDKRAPSS